MYMFMSTVLAKVHVSELNLKKIEKSDIRQVVFNEIIIGHNLISLEVVNRVATFVCEQSISHLKEVTINEIEENIGQIYDISDNLV